MQNDPNIRALRDLNAKFNFEPCDDKEASTSMSSGKITALQLINAGLGTTGAQALASAMAPYQDVLTTLLLSGNAIRPLGLSTLLGTLTTLRTLTRLSIINEQLGDDGIALLASTLPHIPVLSQLTISRNGISGEGAVALAAALPSCLHLQRFVAHSNPFGNAGIISLAKGLAHMPGLRTLGLSGTRMGDDGLIGLLETFTLPNGISAVVGNKESAINPEQLSHERREQARSPNTSTPSITEGNYTQSEGSLLPQTQLSLGRSCNLEVCLQRLLVHGYTLHLKRSVT
jgi:hypothetical protein